MSVVNVIMKQKAAALGRGLQGRYSLFHTEKMEKQSCKRDIFCSISTLSEKF